MAFSKDFLWGAATAAPQIEGGWNEDGRTPSIWDIAPSDKIKNGANCHTACDHYHRMKEDIALMKKIGLKSYRFSISWSRVIPSEGKVNPKGLQFYSDLVDELLKNNIEPMVTIYHWDMPLWVYEKGGWLSSNIIPLFAEYTKVVVDALSDRVTYWIPMNEPQCFIMNGHMVGAHAPFKHRYLSLPRLTRNCLYAHKQSVDTIRKYAKKPPKIGIAMAAACTVPENETPEAIEKARHATFEGLMGSMSNRWFADPIFKGKPVCVYGVYRTTKKDMPKMQCQMDFIGINVYAPMWTKQLDKNTPPERRTSMNWIIDGRCLYWTARFFHERYGLPIMVTENGMAWNDIPQEDGTVADNKRIDFIREYIGELKKATDDGIPIIGYQYWSLMDNFEWAEGYEPRFGLVYVDYKTQQRTLKNSAFEYKKIIESNGEIL